MACIGPRPALWNQYDLIAERDKYGANDIRPGLTGWAQINGRDELPIEIKAKLDGEYVQRMSFRLDVKCFFGTIISVLKKDGIVEGRACNSETTFEVGIEKTIEWYLQNSEWMKNITSGEYKNYYNNMYEK